MTLKTWIVFNHYYRGLRLNGWPKEEAAKAARRHVRRMTPREIEMEAKLDETA